MHEVDPTYGGLIVDQTQARDVARWRKAERERLIATRLALSVSERDEAARRIARSLDGLTPNTPETIVSLYWSFRGEPDLRFWMAERCVMGGRVALPVVIAKGQPLVFREWTPAARLERGVWSIPFPVDGVIVTPTVVIAPLVGFDRAGYRLGYGGGFFDRTLAAISPKPVVIGVGYAHGAISTIYPQWRDIPMDHVLIGDDGSPHAKPANHP